MPINKRCERKVGRFTVTQNEPLQELPVGQPGDRADSE
jgi:hypothetical protein